MNSMVSHEAQGSSTKGNALGSVASPYTKGQFQDGGQNVAYGYKAREDGVNSHGLAKNLQYNSHNLAPDSVSGQSGTPASMNDSMQSSSMANYNGNFNRNSYGMNDQHGGLANTSTADFPSQNAQYNQYGPSSMRGGYPPGPRGSQGPNRTGIPQPGMNMMGSNYPSNPQRFPMSGPSMQQPGGPTPTLNQLLQNPNAAQRYQAAGYGYDTGGPKGNGDMTGGNPPGGNFSQGWTGPQQRPMNPYQQQQMQQQGYRSQQGHMYNQGSPQQSGSYNHQYPYPPSSTPQRFPPQRPHPNSNSQQPFSNSSQNDSQSNDRQSNNTPTENGEHEPSPSSSSHLPQQENSVSSNGGDDSNPGICENGNGASPQHPSVQALRPSPSPGPGSHPGSRSNTPGSLPGQANSPMPPARPPSNHSPLSNQGNASQYNNQSGGSSGGGPMMPPPPSSGPPPHQPPQYNNKPPYQYPHNPHNPHNMQAGVYPRYPSQSNSYPGMYGGNASMPGVPRPAGFPPYHGSPMPPTHPPHPQHPHQYYNDVPSVPPSQQQQGPGGPLPGSKGPGGSAAQAAQAVVAAAESQSKGSPRPMDMMNGPRGNAGATPPMPPHHPHPQAANSNSGGSGAQSNHMDNTSSSSSSQNTPSTQATPTPPTGSSSSSSSTKQQQQQQQEDTGSVKSSASASMTPQPPSPESSQDSLTNQTTPGDDDDDEQKSSDAKQESLSHPSTPAPAASPSLSSIQEDSNLSWPGTPASQHHAPGGGTGGPSASSSASATPQPLSSARIQNQDVFARLCEMGEEPDRAQFLEALFGLLQERGNPITAVPSISKTAIDLYRLYHLTKERGGAQEVTKQKKWRDISNALSIGASSSAGFTLKKNYCKYVLPYECRYDLNNADPAPIAAVIEASQKKDSRKSSSSGTSSNGGGGSAGGPPMMGGPMMPPNVSMMGGAGGQQGGQPSGMYDQGGPGPGMMGGMPGADGYGGANGGQYGPPRMSNHYNQPSTSAPNQYDNRVYDGQQQRYGGPPGSRPNDQYNAGYPQQNYYPPGAGGSGYQGGPPKGQGMYPKPPGGYPNSPYPPGGMQPSGGQYDNAGTPGNYMPSRRDQWSGGDRSRAGGSGFGPPVSSSQSPSPTPPLYKQQQGQGQQHRMSPQRSTSGGDSSAKPFAQAKMQKSTPGFQQKKEIVFPPDSVEATEPRLVKRKRVTHRDIEKVGPWHLYMALKSGQLAESTWALDVLSVLLYDDHTVAYFGLAHMPGMLEVLCEHLRRVLIDTFGAPFLEQEILSGAGSSSVAAPSLSTPAPGETEQEQAECERVLRNAPFHVAEQWAGFTGVTSSSQDWQLGHGDTTRHVITHMDSDDAHQFYRQRFRKRPAPTSVDEAREASSERVAIMLQSDEEEEEEEEEEGEEELNTSRTSLLNESGAEVKDLITSIECNEMDKKRLERLKRKMERGDEESESYERNAPPLCLMTDAQGELARRCVCISNILRNLSFIPGNDREMSRHHGLLRLAGQLLLLHHRHPKRRRMPKQHAPPAPAPADPADSTPATATLTDSAAAAAAADDDTCCGGGGNKDEWWWETLEALRENALVIFSNISGHIKMAELNEEICFPVLDGLLHWSVCPSAYAQDPLPGLPHTSVLSPQRLVLEALCKLCVTDTNVDLLLATPPFSRLVQLFACLVRQLDDTNDQVLREFSIVLLSSLVAGDSSAARAVALTHPAISQLLHFVEVAEANASKLAKNGQLRMLHEHPEMMGTSMDMLRRAAAALTHLSAIHENRSLFLPHQPRLLALVMSSILDNQVISSLSTVLFNCTSHENTDYEYADH